MSSRFLPLPHCSALFPSLPSMPTLPLRQDRVPQYPPFFHRSSFNFPGPAPEESRLKAHFSRTDACFLPSLQPSPRLADMISSAPLPRHPSSSSLPSLPTELKTLILHFCDPQTLARTAQASLAFLHLASPLLYRDAVIEGADQLHKLFCSRRVSPSSSFFRVCSEGRKRNELLNREPVFPPPFQPTPSQPNHVISSPRLEADLCLSQIKTLTFVPTEDPQVRALPGRFDRIREDQRKRTKTSPDEFGLDVDAFTIAIRPGSSSRPL